MALAKIRPPAIAAGHAVPQERALRPPLSPRAALRALGISRRELNADTAHAWAIGVPVGVISLIALGALLEPAPAEEATGAMAALEAAVSIVLLAGAAAATIGAMTLRRWGIGAALGVALVSLGLVVSCPVSGHHTFGMWFAGELALVTAAVGVGTLGLLRTKDLGDSG